jgi:predicted dehydrogenase
VNDAPIRIGLLGAARIAPMAIIEPARARDDVRVTAVAARDSGRAQAYAREHGIEGVSDNYEALIARDDVDLVYIALPPDLHCRWAIAALEAGKAVLCEKPFALNATEAQAMVATAQRTGQLLIEAFHYRFHDLMAKALQLMSDGAIGTPLTAAADVRYPIPWRAGEPRWSAEHGGGALMDLGCYGLHALRALLGAEPEIISSKLRIEHGVDVETRAILRFAGVDAVLNCAMNPIDPSTTIQINGSEGRLDIAGLVLPQRAGRLTLTRGADAEDVPISGPTSYAAQLDHVLAVLRGTEPQITGGADAIANMTAIDAILDRSKGVAN